MSDFAPPSGPPPPRVPEGWKAVWNQQYQEWFYVNIYTKQSSWEKPTSPATRPDDDAPPSGPPPPSYHADATAPRVSDTKKPLDSNNPYNNNNHGRETDEEMARRLQREEEARSHGPSHSPNPQGSTDRGHADSYYAGGHSPQPQGLQGGYPGGPSPGSNPSNFSPTGDAKRGSGGLFGKLKDKFGGSQQGSSGYPPRPGSYNQQPYMGQQQYGGYPQQQQQYGGYPQQQQQYGGYPQQGYMQQGYAQQPVKKKGGLGAGGAAALGVGGGLLGGMLLADAMEDHDQNEYDQGYDAGADGGDFGGGDF